ncbi:MAG: hypothetical protein WAK25_09015, partial [Acidobacteriaceae bacterium]
LTRLAALAVVLTLATAAWSQAPQTVQPSSQGTNQSAPQNTPQPSQPGSPQPPAHTPPPTPPPQGPPAPLVGPPTPALALASSQPTTYTATDGSASALLPAGWQVVAGSEGLIKMTGSQNGEVAILGRVMGAHNAPYNASQNGANNTGMSMPYASTFEDKVAMIYDRLVVVNGATVPQGSVTSVTPIPVGRAIGQCARFTGAITATTGNFSAAGILCVGSLENAGDFKNILWIVQVPASEAATLPQLAQQLITSYNAPIATLQVLLKPWDQIAGRPVVLMDAGDSQCFELAVIHLTPSAQLPRACGGTAP